MNHESIKPTTPLDEFILIHQNLIKKMKRYFYFLECCQLEVIDGL